MKARQRQRSRRAQMAMACDEVGVGRHPGNEAVPTPTMAWRRSEVGLRKQRLPRLSRRLSAGMKRSKRIHDWRRYSERSIVVVLMVRPGKTAAAAAALGATSVEVNIGTFNKLRKWRPCFDDIC